MYMRKKVFTSLNRLRAFSLILTIILTVNSIAALIASNLPMLPENIRGIMKLYFFMMLAPALLTVFDFAEYIVLTPDEIKVRNLIFTTAKMEIDGPLYMKIVPYYNSSPMHMILSTTPITDEVEKEAEAVNIKIIYTFTRFISRKIGCKSMRLFRDEKYERAICEYYGIEPECDY